MAVHGYNNRNPTEVKLTYVREPQMIGKLEYIGLRPQTREPVISVPSAELREETGLDGDYHNARDDRQVTLFRWQDLDVIAAALGYSSVRPEKIRRNLGISQVDLAACIGSNIQIGDAVLLATGPCRPCRRMEEEVGPGALRAMRDLGGLTARVLRGGTIRVGDCVRVGPGL